MRLSIGTSRTDKVWKQVDWTWPRFIEEARRHRTVGTETHAEYMAMPRSKQDLLKDNGGFVAAALAVVFAVAFVRGVALDDVASFI